MINFTSDQWVIVALIFVLGLLVGGFLFSGGGRKWKLRHREEVARRERLEAEQREREKAFELREKEWREQDSLRAAAIKNRPADLNRDGVVTPREADVARDDGLIHPDADLDRDGVPDRKE